MIELTQFIKWLARRVWVLPRRMYDGLTDAYGHDDWYIPLVISCIGVGTLGLLVGVVLYKVLHNEFAAIISLVIWTVGGLFVVTAGVRAMRRAFKQEQNEFIRRLKNGQ
ncbi:hypothetical protein UFOVP190_337 [uncultured Caudovirales phage]|uniref:Uncharacterized protein n=1 Tax=uncultured Caudovirales phage TaxID=2100421 RepID=A0A6J7WHY9_9CAUD|nr:hypothetical protein UFOVP190_337 [uncultured Caudovirales phage]